MGQYRFRYVRLSGEQLMAHNAAMRRAGKHTAQRPPATPKAQKTAHDAREYRFVATAGGAVAPSRPNTANPMSAFDIENVDSNCSSRTRESSAGECAGACSDLAAGAGDFAGDVVSDVSGDVAEVESADAAETSQSAGGSAVISLPQPVLIVSNAGLEASMRVKKELNSGVATGRRFDRDAPSTSDVLSTKAHSSSSRSSVGASCRDYNLTREIGSVVRLAPDYATLGGASSSQTGSPHVTSKNSVAREAALPSKDGLSTEAAPLVWAGDAIADVTLQCDVSDDDDSVCVVEEVPRVKQEMNVYGRILFVF